MKLPKIKWRVQPASTGKYRSFQKRGWPQAIYPDGSLMAGIVCTDEYYPTLVKEGNHAELTLIVYDYSEGPSGPDSTKELGFQVLAKL